MMASITKSAAIAIVAAMACSGVPAVAKDKKAAGVALTRCEAPLGSIAVVDGDTQGWTKYGLGSPRDLIAGMAAESGCFTLINAAGGQRADFLVNAIAGDKEQVDQGMNIARTALVEGAVRSGALGAVAGRVPIVGGMLGGLMGGFGGKKKTVAAGLRVISPATGQTIVAGSGEASKTSISIGGFGAMGGNPYADAARAHIVAAGYGQHVGAYASSKDGQLLTQAFVKAFNAVVAQGAAIKAVAPAR
jgi:hypothetical protein